MLPGGAPLLLAAVLPGEFGAGLAAVETTGDLGDPAAVPDQRPAGAGGGDGSGVTGGFDPLVALFPAEAATLGRAVDKRRREFTTGRICAHRALAALDVPPVPILPGDRREPRWPAGVLGSITHCAGYRAAAVARVGVVASLGIDAEPDAPTPGGVFGEVTVPAERPMIDDLARAHPGVCWDRLLFSAKEAVYKAWFPLARRWLGFTDAELTIDPPGSAPGGAGDAGTFSARLLVPGPALPDGELRVLTGRWVARGGLVVTAVTVPDAGPDRGPATARSPSPSGRR